MKVAIMQPYFLPYIGYFQLINAVDCFVVYDNIEYTKKGWINRNRILVNGKDDYITLPIKKDSDYLHVSQRFLSESWTSDKIKLQNRIAESYRKAPFFREGAELFQNIIQYPNNNLFAFIFHSLKQLCEYLEIKTELVVSSELNADHELKSEQKVISICRALNADAYINPSGGKELYNAETFKAHNIDLFFLQSNAIVYPQLKSEFVPWLSILDVIMFNSKEQISDMLNHQYNLS